MAEFLIANQDVVGSVPTGRYNELFVLGYHFQRFLPLLFLVRFSLQKSKNSL